MNKHRIKPVLKWREMEEKKSSNAIKVSGHRLNSTKLVSFNLVSVATTATTATHQFYPLHRHLRDSGMETIAPCDLTHIRSSPNENIWKHMQRDASIQLRYLIICWLHLRAHSINSHSKPRKIVYVFESDTIISALSYENFNKIQWQFYIRLKWRQTMFFFPARPFALPFHTLLQNLRWPGNSR